jgi:hypothetical protein
MIEANLKCAIDKMIKWIYNECVHKALYEIAPKMVDNIIEIM